MTDFFSAIYEGVRPKSTFLVGRREGYHSTPGAMRHTTNPVCSYDQQLGSSWVESSRGGSVGGLKPLSDASRNRLWTRTISGVGSDFSVFDSED
jgi:hypothetical protein